MGHSLGVFNAEDQKINETINDLDKTRLKNKATKPTFM